MAWRSTQRTDLSQPPDYRTYSPEVTSSRSNLPVHRSAAGRVFPFHASLIIIKDFPRNVNRNFYVFYEILKIFLGAPPGRGDRAASARGMHHPGAGGSRLKGVGTGDRAASARGMHPPFSFWRPKKRTGRARSKRKNAARWASASGSRKVSARGVGCAWVLEVWDTPCFFFRLRSLRTPG